MGALDSLDSLDLLHQICILLLCKHQIAVKKALGLECLLHGEMGVGYLVRVIWDTLDQEEVVEHLPFIPLKREDEF